MIKKSLFLIFFTFCLLTSFGYSGERKSVDQMPIERIDMVEQILTEKEELTLRQYDELRKEILQAMDTLERQNHELQTKIQKSSGERKQDLENRLSQVTACIERAQHQLQIVNKEKIQTQATYLFSIQSPLYQLDTVIEETIGMYRGFLMECVSFGQSIMGFVKQLLQKNQLGGIFNALFSISIIGFFYYLSKRKILKWVAFYHQKSSLVALQGIRSILDTSFLAVFMISLFSLLGKQEANFSMWLGFAMFFLMRWAQLFFKEVMSYPLEEKEKQRLTSIKRSLFVGIPLVTAHFLLHHFSHQNMPVAIPVFVVQIAIAITFMNLIRSVNISSLKEALIDLLLLSFPLMVFLGFSSLSQYLFQSLMGTLGFYFLLKILHKGFLAGLALAFVKGHFAFTRIPITDKSRRIVKHWINALFILFTGCLFVYFTLIIWRVDPVFVNDWMKMLIFGLKIGPYTFSLFHLFIGLFVFAAILLLTRYFQFVLKKHVFPYTNMDIGLRHTLSKTTGYLGMAIATLLGISAMGINIASFYFVLGGLSVGIGLGLQQIVMNFLSGVVMLIERPLKIGDIVDVGEETGTVKTINVRTTEIETGDRSVVILPNSYVINNRIKNWTKHDRMRRCEVKVKVNQESDPYHVSEVLLTMLEPCSFILSTPSPKIYFQEILEGYYLFNINFYIAEASNHQEIKSKVLYMVHETCHSEGIEFANFPSDFFSSWGQRLR